MRQLLEKHFRTHGDAICVPCVIGVVLLAVVVMLAIGAIFRIGEIGPVADEEVDDAAREAFVEEVVQHGQILLTERLNAGDDLSHGPCLDNGDTFADWVIDIAHDPREAVDGEPENQCSAYRRGSAKNFVELSLRGDVIRTSMSGQ